MRLIYPGSCASTSWATFAIFAGACGRGRVGRANLTSIASGRTRWNMTSAGSTEGKPTHQEALAQRVAPPGGDNASELLVRTAENSLNLTANVWHGVDVFEIVAQRCAGRLAGDSADIVAEWLHSYEAKRLLPCLSPPLADALSMAARSVHAGLPFLETHLEDLNASGTYGAVHLEARILISGQLQLRFDTSNLTFSVAWANPLWELAAFETSVEKEQIMKAISSVLIRMPSKNFAWQESDVAASSWLIWMEGKLWRVVRLMWILVRSLCGYGFMVTWWLGAWLAWWFRREISFLIASKWTAMRG